MAPRRRGLASARKAAGYTQESLAAALEVDRTTVIRWEAGDNEPQPYYWPQLIQLLDVSREELRQLIAGSNDSPASVDMAPPAVTEVLDADRPMLDRRAVLRGAAAVALGLHDAEALRRQLTDAVDHAAMSDASLDDWEHTVQQYGLAARYRPAASLLTDLTADFAELCRLLEYRRAILVPNRLTRIMAQMAGLMTIPLNQLNQAAASRNWARTAKIFARQAGDAKIHAWVLVQQACTHYYSGNLAEAVYVAARAQHIANHAACPEVANAAAFEARAYASLGKVQETRAALERAERAIHRMESQASMPSAFSYEPARFHFHAGNAYTHLGETAAAASAHEQALASYPKHEYLDPALVALDRAECLVIDNEVESAADQIANVLHGVGAEQRNSMIDNRARHVLGRVPARAARLSAVRELREIVGPLV